ncbi:TetR/AcrR family transcriptional regulator [Denitratisoma oestradiolicum]|uniref:Uncharacterized protein n=1 Tax=Denitratisoma oestradiolicum TaxID=311182 RepID=A0A6S6XXC8_9PROT|nr:TetR/AcrR family transcriptional regulator [Denitratisoma oestradiolicum]TWO79834.1 hypothetical protein CBW56_13020 [Denitratisoma oestradiolicum]CAB1369529.1 conserved protein of unknown function [Denitratisoma oestradiolicum]
MKSSSAVRRKKSPGAAKVGPELARNKLETHRRLPTQRRAKHTVDSMLIAARALLAEGGATAVTTRAVAERAGVGVGSLYEYFPNREAILAHLAEELLQQEARVANAEYARIRAQSLPEYLDEIFGRTLQVERKMLALGGDFHRRYTHHYQLWAMHEKGRLSVAEMVDGMTQILAEHGVGDRVGHLPLAAHLLARGIRAMIASLVEDRPDLLGTPELDRILGRIVRAIVDLPNPNTTQDRD